MRTEYAIGPLMTLSVRLCIERARRHQGLGQNSRFSRLKFHAIQGGPKKVSQIIFAITLSTASQISIIFGTYTL